MIATTITKSGICDFEKESGDCGEVWWKVQK
jgi:hypothetical protein